MNEHVFAPLRVLLVEDEPALQRALTRLLSGPRALVTVAATVERAFELLASSAFDVVLSDVHLGDESGLALAERVRELHPALARRVVLMTASADSGPLDEMAEALGCPLIRKPFGAEDFFRVAVASVQG